MQKYNMYCSFNDIEFRKAGNMTMVGMRRLGLIWSILLVLWTSIIALADPNTTGKITRVEATQTSIIVEGYTNSGSLWLGCTIRPDAKAMEEDRKPIKVKGQFKESFTGKSGVFGEIPFAVALWRNKINKSQCSEINRDNACNYCQRNGFHMEGRVDYQAGIIEKFRIR
jgi:hypothetical protein